MMLLSWQLLELELRELFRSTCMSVAQDLGLSVSMSKSTMMVTGREVTEEDTAPICVGVDEIECVSEFQYLGSLWSQQQEERNRMCIGELPRLRSTSEGSVWEQGFD